MTRYLAIVATTALAGLLGGTIYLVTAGAPEDRFAACRESQVAGGAGAIGGPFALTDQSGQRVTDGEVLSKPSLVYFGYTFCPDVCPLDNARNAEAVDLLDAKGHEVTPVFISVDPKRDTPPVLAEFAEVMHPRMIALTGSEEEIKTASQAYKTYFKINDTGDEYYLVDHSTFTYLMLPKTGFVEFFRREDSAEKVADRVACFIDADRGV